MKSLSLILEKQNSEIVSIYDSYSKMSFNLTSREKKTNAATQYQLLVAKQKLVITSTKRKKENLNVNLRSFTLLTKDSYKLAILKQEMCLY